VCQFPGFQVEKDETLEQVVVKNEIDVEILALGADALLPGDEGKTFAQFEQEGLKIRDEGVFEL